MIFNKIYKEQIDEQVARKKEGKKGLFRYYSFMIFKLNILVSSAVNLSTESASAAVTGKLFHCGIVLRKKPYL